MNTKEIAAQLNERDRRELIKDGVDNTAKENNIVITFGDSDDLISFRGAIHDETDGLFEVREPFDDLGKMIHFLKEFGVNVANNEIEAIWHEQGNPCWTIETEIPHETFEIMEDDEVFSVGIVFSMNDLKS